MGGIQMYEFKIGDWGFNPSTKEHRRINSEKDMENLENFQKLQVKCFDSYYAKKDEVLPYVFDLLYDIKTLGELWHRFHNGLDYHNIQDLEETMIDCNVRLKEIDIDFTDEYKEDYNWLFDEDETV